MPGLYFRVLGPVTVERDEQPVDVGGPQSRSVLSLLLLEAGRVVSVDQFIDALWGVHPPASARVQLQGMVSELRRALGVDGVRASAPIETRAPGYRLRLAPGELDLAEFRREVVSAREHAEAAEPRATAGLLRSALARWHGPAFADIACPVVQRAAAGLDEMRLAALEDRIDADLALGRHDELITELRALQQAHPLRERFCGQLMTVLAREGRLADALAEYRDARARTVEELGVEPSTRLQQLHRALLSGATGPADSPGDPVRSLCFVVPRQLPADVPGLVGRAEPLNRAQELLTAESRSTPPCVAITGPGGVGKTALALRLAHRLRDHYVDGQLWARLGGVTAGQTQTGQAQTAEVLAKFLRALGVPPGGVPTDLAERSGLLRELLFARRVLLVLDDVADEAQVRPLLPAEPRCGVLVTSRHRLPGLEAMRSIPLDVLPDDRGAELFHAIAGVAGAEAEPHEVAQVVRHCGGLPLAIRIAGARLASRPNWLVADMAKRLGSHRDRLDWLQHGDLGVRACLQDTYTALTTDQQRLFRRLGLLNISEFPSWVPAALLDERAGAADRLLNGLLDMHLVEPAGRGSAGPRYRMHDLIHLLAGELAAADEVAERRAALGRVLDGWLDLTTVADAELPHWHGLDPEPAPQWRAPEEVRAAVRAAPLSWLDEERDCLLAQVRYAADERYPSIAWPLAQRLTTYLDLRGQFDDWATVLSHGLRAAEQAADRRGIACTLGLLTDVEASRAQIGVSADYAIRAVAAYQALADDPPNSPDLPYPTLPERSEAEQEGPADLLAALEQARRCDDPPGIGVAAYQLCRARRHTGVHGGYLALFEEAREAFAACGAPLAEMWMIKNAGLAYLKQGRLDEAARLMERGLSLLVELGDFHPKSVTCDIADVFATAGRFDEAEALARETMEHARAHRHWWDEIAALETLGGLCRARGDQHGAIDAYTAALSLGRRLKAPDRVAHTLNALTELDGLDPTEPRREKSTSLV